MLNIESRQGTLAYNIEFDKRKPINESFIRTQVETHIGERLNVLLSTRRYDLKNGILYGEDSEEPFIDVIKRGRDYRKDNGTTVDRPRENAEVTGFTKIQEVLGDPNTPEGAMMLSISPPGKDGSIYEHNFYDVFTLREGYVELRRYSSALNADEYKRLGLNTEQNFDDAALLSNPVKINHERFNTADEIHEYLHKKHGFTSVEDYKKVIEDCTSFILAYIRALIEDDDFTIKLSFNAILNRADIASVSMKKYGSIIPSNGSIIEWGSLPVRQTPTGCGSSGGFSISSGSPFSVSEFGVVGEDKYGDRKFECPDCGETNIRPENKLISKCQHCGSNKVAC